MDEPTRPVGADDRGPRHAARQPVVNAARLWVGGLLAGVVAAGVAIVGLLIARGIFDVEVFVPRGEEGLFTPSTMWYAGAAFLAAAIATGLLHLLLVARAPAPFTFFFWIIGLVTAIGAIIPFTTNADLDAQIATAAINLAIGITILSILPFVGRSAMQSSGDAMGFGAR